jgi:hypothetical protein
MEVSIIIALPRTATIPNFANQVDSGGAIGKGFETLTQLLDAFDHSQALCAWLRMLLEYSKNFGVKGSLIALGIGAKKLDNIVVYFA